VRIWENEEDQVEIIEVDEDSPAEIADLEEGDVILEFEGEVVRRTETLQKMIRMRRPGENVTIKIDRDGETKEVDVKLGELTEEDIWNEFESKFPTLFTPQKKRIAPGPPLLEGRPDVFRFDITQRKFIGVYTRPLNPELAEYFGVDKGTGLLIERLEEDGPAEKAGLRVGDVILRADGERVETTEKLSRYIQDKEKGDKINIEYLRNKKKQSVEVEVEEEDSRAPVTLYRDPQQFTTWRNYMNTYETQSQKLAETYKRMGEDRYKLFMENQKKMDDQWKDAEKYYQDALKTLRFTSKKKKGIRV